ncbi:DUF6714 family protein [Pseudoduganella violaceinigra]|uniref:DUF6714 family protein n=1 Tax=Pseudoduganella violaceinigra TaxID=246602 RepID=UPI0003F55644|nr:DUF6714 family protein [Pseudoduganella violaceinigra]
MPPPINQEELIARIRLAWADATPPAAHNISGPTHDDEGVSAYFAGKSWEGHSARALRGLEFATSVFTDEAFAYYLPAYLIAAIEDPDTLDVVVDGTLSALARKEHGRAVIARLDAQQRQTLRDYMRLLQERGGYFMDHYIANIEASLEAC